MDPNDVPGFSEANAYYEDMHPEDTQLVCEYCDGEGCPECGFDEEDEE